MKQRVLYSILSVGLLVYLPLVTLTPNSGSVLAEVIPTPLESLASSLGLVASWSFFAPNPTTQRLIHVQVTTKNDTTDSWVWPPKDRPIYIWQNQLRLFNHSRTATSRPEHIYNYFVPWACRRVEDARSVRVSFEVLRPEPLQKYRLENRKGLSEVGELAQSYGEVYDCPERKSM